jgi:hypothetical protein
MVHHRDIFTLPLIFSFFVFTRVRHNIILSPRNSVHTSDYLYSESTLILFPHFCLGLLNRSSFFPSGFPTTILCSFLHEPICRQIQFEIGPWLQLFYSCCNVWQVCFSLCEGGNTVECGLHYWQGTLQRSCHASIGIQTEISLPILYLLLKQGKLIKCLRAC